MNRIRPTLLAVAAVFSMAAAQAQTTGITGTVTATAGFAPLEGVSVQVWAYDEPGADWYYTGSTVTDENGEYIFGTVEGWFRVRYSLNLNGNSYSEWYNDAVDLASATDIHVLNGSTSDASVMMTAGARITGTVVGPDGTTPLDAVPVSGYLWNEGSGTWDLAITANTKADGSYLLAGLDPGNYIIKYDGSNYDYLDEYHFNKVDMESAISLGLPGTEFILRDINAAMGGVESPGGSIAGTVVGPDGTTPLASVVVLAYRWNISSEQWEQITYGSTDADGTYLLIGLKPGTYRVEFYKDSLGYQEYYDNAVDMESATDIEMVEISGDTDITGIDAALGGAESPGGSISGTVVGPGGTPLEAVEVYLEKWNTKQELWLAFPSVYTQANGTYQHLGLSPGTYRILFISGTHGYPWEYYDNAVNAENSTNVVVAGNRSVITGINAALGSALSNVATLRSFALSAGPLSPVFAAGATNYTLTVPNGVASTTVTPTLTNANGSVRVNGTLVGSGSASASIPLAVGANTITVEVTAEDGTTKRTYTVTVTRNASSNGFIKKMTLKGAKLSPAFAVKKFSYKTTVSPEQKSLQIQVRTVNSAAKIRIDGQKVKSGEMSKPVLLNKKGKTIIKIVVTAQDGSKKTYSVTVTKKDPN